MFQTKKDNLRDSARGDKRVLSKILDSFSGKQTLIFAILALVIFISAISILGKINKKFLIYRPENGGTLTEGVLGAPRFINPILATSDTDRDLVSLIYAGLMKKTPEGTIIPDLAERYEVSPDGLTYTFHIKAGAEFQDKTPLTADDVIFTIEKAKDPLVKSPFEAVWQGVNVYKNEGDNSTVVFRLSEPYAAFLENATLGILPKTLWEKFGSEEFSQSENNLNAVGAGPYKIASIKEHKNRLIEEIKLVSFSQGAGAHPFITHFDFKFFKGEDDLVKAYRKGRVDQIGSISPKIGKELEDAGFEPTTATLSRIFGLFFNPNNNEILRDKKVIQAMELAINKEDIVNRSLYGFGSVIDNPVPRALLNGSFVPPSPKDSLGDLTRAADILDSDGWKLNAATGLREKGGKTLELSISTADVTELRASAEIIKEDLEKVGMKVSVKVFEVGILNQNVIRPREYEILFFGQVVRNESDLFAFWHSSQRTDPGLNIAVYTNNKVDKILEDLIAANDKAVRISKMNELMSELKTDMPAIFIYSPQFIYFQSPKVEGVRLDHITSSPERFLNVTDWYMRTDSIWKFLSKNNN